MGRIRTRSIAVLAAASLVASLAAVSASTGVTAAATTPLKVTISAKSQVIVANGGATTTVTVKVTRNGKPVKGVAVSYSPGQLLVEAAAGLCGSVKPTAGKTSGKGTFTTTYSEKSPELHSAVKKPGFCFLTATVADPITVTQAIAQESATLKADHVHYTITPTPTSVTVDDTASPTTTLKLTVKDGMTLINGDPSAFISEIASVPGSCGAISPSQQNTGPSNPNGVVALIYTPSTTVGTCTLKGQEALTGATSVNVVVHQKKPTG